MNIDFDALKGFIVSAGIMPLFILVFIVGMYMFWRETRFSRKNRNSVFDMYLSSTIIGGIWGRLSYIISNYSEFKDLPWFLFPYERYTDGFFVFRLLPWRYFRIWDGGFLFTGIFVAMILGGFIYSTFWKKWRWKDMMGAVYSSFSAMLAMTLFFYGYLTDAEVMLRQGLNLMIICTLYFIGTIFLNIFKMKNPARYDSFNRILIVSFVVSFSYYVGSIFLSSQLSQIDIGNVYVYIGFTLISLIYYLYDSFKVEINIETETNIRVPISITTNQPVRVRKDNEK